jgi:hypothetical protein
MIGSGLTRREALRAAVAGALVSLGGRAVSRQGRYAIDTTGATPYVYAGLYPINGNPTPYSVTAVKVTGTFTVPNPPNPAPQVSIRLRAFDAFDFSLEDYGLFATVNVFPGAWTAGGTFPFEGSIVCRNAQGFPQPWPAGWWWAYAELVIGPTNGNSLAASWSQAFQIP